MWTPILTTLEEPDPPVDPVDHTSLAIADSERPSTMSPRDWLVLGKVFEGKKAKQIAAELSLSYPTIVKTINAPAFQRWVEYVEEGILERISRGEFGAMAIAKAHAVEAMGKLVGLMRGADDERVKLNATLEVIKFSGLKPPTPQPVQTVDMLLDQLTADEAEHFAQTGIFPERLSSQVARVASHVIRDHDKRQYEGAVVEGVFEHAEEPVTTSVRREFRRLAPEELPANPDMPDVDEDGDSAGP